jgi:hypothetical protein
MNHRAILRKQESKYGRMAEMCENGEKNVEMDKKMRVSWSAI